MRSGIVALLALAALLPGATPLRAASESASALLARGNAEYEAGDYEKAIETYDAVLDSGIEDAVVHYNLGNAWFKAGRLGWAIWHYRKAHALAPRDEDILANLDYARFLVLDRLDEGARTDQRIEGWLDRVTPAEAFRLPALLFLLAGLAGVVWQLAPGRATAARRSFVVLLGLWGLSCGLAAAVQHRATGLDEAVVLPREAPVHNGPGESFDVAFVLHEGAEAVVEGERGSWIEISLPGELRGWIPADRVARL